MWFPAVACYVIPLGNHSISSILLGIGKSSKFPKLGIEMELCTEDHKPHRIEGQLMD